MIKMQLDPGAVIQKRSWRKSMALEHFFKKGDPVPQWLMKHENRASFLADVKIVDKGSASVLEVHTEEPWFIGITKGSETIIQLRRYRVENPAFDETSAGYVILNG